MVVPAFGKHGCAHIVRHLTARIAADGGPTAVQSVGLRLVRLHSSIRSENRNAVTSAWILLGHMDRLGRR